MKSLNLTLIFAFWALSLSSMFGQSIQKGFVFEYDDNMNRVPLSNVEIVVTNAASTASDANGEFSLRFRQLKPGDRIIVRRCIKSGYSIADESSLEHLYITGDDTRINIYLCRTEKLMEVRRNLVRHATETANTRYEEDQRLLSRNLQQQQITKAEYEAKLEKLKAEYEAKLNNIDNYIDRFVKLDLTELTAEEKEIMSLVHDGQFEKAIAAYDKLDLSGRLVQQTRNLKRLDAASDAMAESEQSLHTQRKNLRNAVLRQCDLLYMQGGPETTEKVNNLIRELAMIDTTNVYNMLVYARLMMEQTDYKEAYRIYESLISSAQQNRDSMALLRAQCYLAVPTIRLGRRAEGVAMMERCLPIFDSLRVSRSDTLTLLRDEADFCRVLATHYFRINDTDQASYYFRRAIFYLRVLRIETTLKALDSQYAIAISQAALFMTSKWGDESALLCRESIRIFEELSISKPHLYQHNLAYAHRALGRIYMEQGRNEEAEPELLQAEQYYRKSAIRNPDRVNRYLAECLLNLGDLYVKSKDYNRSLQCLDEAQKLYLNESNGRVRNREVLSMINYTIGKCSYHLGDYETALHCNLISLADLEPLYKAEPDVFREQMATRLVHLYNVYVRLRDFSKAEFYLQRAIEVDSEHKDVQHSIEEFKTIKEAYN